MASEICKKAMIASVSVQGIWTAVGEDKEASASLAKQKGIRQDVYRAIKRIVDPKMVPTLKTFNSERATLYDLHRRMTLAWNDKGGRMLPMGIYFDYQQKIGEAKQRVLDAYELFIQEIPALKLKFQTDPDTAGAYNEGDWPDPAELRERVSVRVRIEPLADAADYRVSLADDELTRLRQDYERDMQGKLAKALVELLGDVKKVVVDAKDRLNSYMGEDGKIARKFHDSAITNVREMIVNARKLNVLGDPNLNSLFDEIDNLICKRDPQDLRDNFFLRQQTVAHADTISRKLASIESMLSPMAEAA